MKTLHELRDDYMALNWTGIDQAAKAHLNRFVEFVIASNTPAAPGGEPDPAVVAATETKTYPDGTTVTGPGPLPDESPTSGAAAAPETAPTPSEDGEAADTDRPDVDPAA